MEKRVQIWKARPKERKELLARGPIWAFSIAATALPGGSAAGLFHPPGPGSQSVAVDVVYVMQFLVPL
jgi:hypothetical protein